MRTKRKVNRRSKAHIALVKSSRRRKLRSRTGNVRKRAAKNRRLALRRMAG